MPSWLASARLDRPRRGRFQEDGPQYATGSSSTDSDISEKRNRSRRRLLRWALKLVPQRRASSQQAQLPATPPASTEAADNTVVGLVKELQMQVATLIEALGVHDAEQQEIGQVIYSRLLDLIHCKDRRIDSADIAARELQASIVPPSRAPQLSQNVSFICNHALEIRAAITLNLDIHSFKWIPDAADKKREILRLMKGEETVVDGLAIRYLPVETELAPNQPRAHEEDLVTLKA